MSVAALRDSLSRHLNAIEAECPNMGMNTNVFPCRIHQTTDGGHCGLRTVPHVTCDPPIAPGPRADIGLRARAETATLAPHPTSGDR